MRDVSELFGASRNLALEKTILLDQRSGELDVIVRGQYTRSYFTSLTAAGWDQARAGNEERAETIPVARSRRAGDYVVERGDH